MSHYQNARFSCTRNYRGWALDGWLGSVIHTRGGNTHIQSEEWVAFAINGSVSGANKIDTEPVWIPNRNFVSCPHSPSDGVKHWTTLILDN